MPGTTSYNFPAGFTVTTSQVYIYSSRPHSASFVRPVLCVRISFAISFARSRGAASSSYLLRPQPPYILFTGLRLQ